MLNISSILKEYSLTTDNSIVIGSGILNALSIRSCNDLDIVVTAEAFKRLNLDSTFKHSFSLNTNLLVKNTLEIGQELSVKEWNKSLKFEDLKKDSIVINQVRYITLEFLLKLKNIWATNPNPREKDLNDIKVIEEYLRSH